MAFLTKQEIADINSVINIKEITESEAQTVLTEYLRWPDVNVEKNIDLLVALKTLLTKEFKINDLKIRYVVDDFSLLNVLAFHESVRGDNIIIIGVDQECLTGTDKLGFLKTMLHEYGHLRMFLKSRSSKRVYKSVKISEDIDKATWWQAIGAISRYGSCKSERFADKFAHKKINKLIKNEMDIYKSQYLREIRSKARLGQIKDDLRYYVCGAGYRLWWAGNTIFHIKQEKKFRIFYNNISYDKKLWEDNLKYPLVFDSMKGQEPQEYVNHHITKNDCSIKGFNNEKKMLILAKAYLKYSLMMASKCGVCPQEIGFGFSYHYSTPEYVSTRDKNPKSPLLGYFIYPTKRAQELKSIGEFFRDLEACYNEKMGIEHQQEG